MFMRSFHKDGFYVIKILEDLNYRTDISDLLQHLQENVSRGNTNIALSFPAACFYTPHIKLLAQCYKIVSASNGSLSIIADSDEMMESILEILGILNLQTRVRVIMEETVLRV
jgi:hypothetical protein